MKKRKEANPPAAAKRLKHPAPEATGLEPSDVKVAIKSEKTSENGFPEK